MTEKKKHVLTNIITFIFVLVALLGVGLVNRNILPSLSGFVWVLVATVAWWPMLLPTVFFMRRDNETLKDIGFTKEKILQQLLSGILVAIGSLAILISCAKKRDLEIYIL